MTSEFLKLALPTLNKEGEKNDIHTHGQQVRLARTGRGKGNTGKIWRQI